MEIISKPTIEHLIAMFPLGPWMMDVENAALFKACGLVANAVQKIVLLQSNLLPNGPKEIYKHFDQERLKRAQKNATDGEMQDVLDTEHAKAFPSVSFEVMDNYYLANEVMQLFLGIASQKLANERNAQKVGIVAAALEGFNNGGQKDPSTLLQALGYWPKMDEAPNAEHLLLSAAMAAREAVRPIHLLCDACIERSMLCKYPMIRFPIKKFVQWKISQNEDGTVTPVIAGHYDAAKKTWSNAAEQTAAEAVQAETLKAFQEGVAALNPGPAKAPAATGPEAMDAMMSEGPAAAPAQ